jgi:predicted acylesterase/phospholipase RssA
VHVVDERQELRIALVMNGGVSLAVWMGGVTLELDRVRRASGVYGDLLELTSTDARVDVIAGASAGGINGAVLALAIARGTTVAQIRELWMTDGDIDLLLRDPMQRDAPSVLQGDEVLLARLTTAMREIGSGGVAPDPELAPLYLAITGTILEGQLSTYPDCFGAPIPDVSHRAMFEFKRSASDGERDDFARSGGTDDAAVRLALAARSSASFPGAFEPSFIPVREQGDAIPGDPTHPNMHGIADFTSDRWVIDGGVLDNTPFGSALDQIRALPAERPVRRVLGFVVPDITVRDERPAAVPSVGEVILDSLSRLPRTQSIGRELAEIEGNNRLVRRRREARSVALETLQGDRLEQTAALLLSTYIEVRRAAAVEDLVAQVIAVRGKVEPATNRQIEDLRESLQTLPDLPWLPDDSAERAFRIDSTAEAWKWGLAPLENAANLALEVLQKMSRSAPEDDDSAVNELRARTHGALATLRDLQQGSNDYWQDNALILLESNEETSRVVNAWGDRYGYSLGELAAGFAEILLTARGRSMLLEEDAKQGSPRMMLGSLEGSSEDVMRRLLALDVVQRATGADLSGIEQEVELVLMSTRAQNSFGLELTPDEKLAGLQAAHFGAFYKRSWRANDWAWGRIDGADRMVRTLLDPRRIKHLLEQHDASYVASEIHRIACASADGPTTEWLDRRFSVTSIYDELRALEDVEGEPLLTDLPLCYAAIRLRAQVEIMLEEVPQIADAVRVDQQAGAPSDSLGAKWEQAHVAGKTLSAGQAFKAFRACDIGRERIEQEIGSDRFTRVSTRGLAVTGSVLGGALPNTKVLKLPLVAIRGLMLTLYLLGRGVTDGTDTGRFLVALTLALGGALVGIYAIGIQVPGLLLLLGAILLIAGVLLSLLQKRRWQLLLSALVLSGSAAGYWVVHTWHGRPEWTNSLAAVLAVALMAGGAMLLGRSNHTRSGA